MSKSLDTDTNNSAALEWAAGARIPLYRRTGFIGLEDFEDAGNYKPGGYHPVDIGDTITNVTNEDNYTMIHKLGFSGYSTVWLARRQRKHPLAGHTLPVSFRALKILRADLGDHTDHELRILRHLGQVETSSHPNIVVLEDSFTITGPNGQHLCLVFPVLGPTLPSYKSMYDLTPSQRHSACQQLASAVAFIHRHDICHGDLTPSNITFRVSGIQSMTEQRLMELLGPLKQETLHHREDTVSGSRRRPKRLVTAASFAGLDRLLTSVQIQIIGFDVAFPTNNPPPTSGCPIRLFPPELLFGCPASAKCDIWQLAANMCYTYVGSYMFQVGFEIFTHLVAFIVEYHGPLPIDWKGRFDWGQYGGYPPGTSDEALDEPGWWFDGTEPTQSFDDRVTRAVPFLSGPQKDELVRLLCDMVVLEPSRRISAAEAERRLKSPVFSPIWEESGR